MSAVAILAVIVIIAAYYFARRAYYEVVLNAPNAPMQLNQGVPDQLPFGADLGPSVPHNNIFVREDKVNQTILVKFSNIEQIYRYNTAAKTIEAASAEDWNNSKEEPSCLHKMANAKLTLYADTSRRTLQNMDARAETPYFGDYPIWTQTSTKGGLAAVVSAAGPKTLQLPGPPLLGGSGGQIAGKRFVRVVHVASNTYITEPVALIPVKEFPFPQICWLDNEKFLIAYEEENINGTLFQLNFSVIETGR